MNSTDILTALPVQEDCAEYFSYYSVRQVTVFVLQPIIYGFGIPGNTLALIIWFLPHMRKSTSGYYFTSLAIADECVLVCHLIFNIQSAYGQSGLLKSDGVCRFFNISFITAQCCSTFIGLAMTVERVFAVKFPLQVHKLFGKHKLPKLIFIILSSSLTVGLLLGLLWNYRFDVDTSSCIVLGTSRRDSGSGFVTTITVMVIVFGIICPICTILVLNVVIIHALLQMRREREAGLPCISRHALAKRKRETNKTVMILCVGMYMVAARTPDYITYLLQPFYPPGSPTLTCDERTQDKTWIEYYDYISAAVIIETFALTSYAFNILIYSLAGAKFRRTAKIGILKVLARCGLTHEPTEEWSSTEVTPFRDGSRPSVGKVGSTKTNTTSVAAASMHKDRQRAAPLELIKLQDVDRNSIAKNESEA